MNNAESEVKSVRKPTRIVLCKFLNISRRLICDSSGFNLEKIFVLNERNVTASCLPSVEYTDLLCYLMFFEMLRQSKLQ